MSKLKCFLFTLYIVQFKNTKDFLLHAVWYEDRAIQLLKFSMSQEVKKGPFAALTFESSKNFILTYFQKLMWFYLLVTKDNLLGKVWEKAFFRCEMPWTDRHLKTLSRSPKDTSSTGSLNKQINTTKQSNYGWDICFLSTICKGERFNIAWLLTGAK